MEREQLLPEWPGPWAAWAWNYCSRNLWRVNEVLGDMDDAMAECALIWVDCRRRYGASAKSPAHMMALYKRMVTSWFHSYSVVDTQIRKTKTEYVQVEAADAEAHFAVKLRQASKELTDVIKILMRGHNEIIAVLREDLKTDKPRDFFRAVAKFCGYESRTNELEMELRGLLQ